jgi:magnesium transporter
LKHWKNNQDKNEHKKRRRDKLRVAHNKPPAGSQAGTLQVPAGSPMPRIRAVRYSRELVEEREIHSEAELRSFCARGGLLWVDVQGLGDRATLEWIGASFALHPLVLADIAHVPQRPKCETYEGSLFTVARRLRWKGDPHDLIDERQVSLVLAHAHVLSFQEREDDVFEPIRARLSQNAGLIQASGSDYLAYALLDAIVDDYLPILDQLGERLEDLEDRAVECPSRALMGELSALRRDLIALRRDVWPQREALHALMRGEDSCISGAVRIYLRDVHDHCVQVAEMVEVYREIASGIQNLYLTSLANRTNEVMKVLTVMATIFIPLTFLVGVWGMNFDHMPELHWKWAYPAVWLMMLAVAGALFVYFRRRGWIGREPE